tara:strand:+ start:3303 stop:4265 length:963 start_codon:yes stop_codon:yes gene_type:complete
MAFLDNSGDIILDAVLTDTGRMRLAKGDGSFRIVKFALGDDEIDYSLFQKDHASGSAYFDLEIMQTPVLEAFTNNASSMKHRLISFSRTDLLYLPVIKINEKDPQNKSITQISTAAGMFFVTADVTTTTNLTTGATFANDNEQGILKGDPNTSGGSPNYIRLDQGIDSLSTPRTSTTAPDLTETSYIVQIDNRFGTVSDSDGNALAVSFIDDDHIATYFASQGQATNGVTVVSPLPNPGSEGPNPSSIAGARGTKLEFRIKSSTDIVTSTFLFTQVGGGNTVTIDSNIYYYIDSNVRITGATTGYSVDVPIRFLKWKEPA